MLLPSQARSASAPSRPVSEKRSRRSSGLHRLLQHLGLSRWESLILAEELDLDMLASMPFADLKVALPTIPSGVLFSLQHHAAEWSTDSGTPCVRVLVHHPYRSSELNESH